MSDDYFNPFDDLGLTEHIKETYSLIFPINITEVILIRRPKLDQGNFGSETPNYTEIRYKVKMNINPVKAKPYSISKEGVVQNFSFEVFTNPTLYPNFGFSDEALTVQVDEILTQVLSTDLIEYQGKKYTLSKTFEDVALNDQPLLWQHFWMQVISKD